MSDSYIEKNRGFITSSKIKAFRRCPKCYKYKYIDEIPDPTTTDTEKDHFLIGQAVDSFLTNGEEKFNEEYEMLAKGAKRSKDSIRTQLTGSHSKTVKSLVKEFKAQPTFNQKPKKHVIEYEYAGFKLRAELDDLDLENRRIKDIKTCANIIKFNPDFYTLQMGFYQWLIEETEGIKCDAMLEIVDKYQYFSRSMSLIYTKETLEGERGKILQTLEDMALAEATGLYGVAKEQNELYVCPYYGYEGHGRPTEPIYY